MKYKALDDGGGQCLSPLTASALIAILTYYLFRSYRIRGMLKRRW